jgi:hypothetical protein
MQHYCRPDWATLPRYEVIEIPPCTDPEGDVQISHLTPNSSQSEISGPLSPVVHPANPSRPPSPTYSPLTASIGLAGIGATSALPYPVAHSLAIDSPSGSHPVTPGTPSDDPTRDIRVQTSQRFASLMAGFEDEGGELPPNYQDVCRTGTSGGNQTYQSSQVIQVAIPSPSRAGKRPKTNTGLSLSRGSGSGPASRDHSESRSRSVVGRSILGTGTVGGTAVGGNTVPRAGSASRSPSVSRTRTPVSLFSHQ